MRLRTLIRRSLRFHWRSHLGVVLGAAIGSAALIGALIVGDSVKGSLHERALERLGEIQFVLEGGDRFFRQSLGDSMPHDLMDNWNEENGYAYFRGGPAAVLILPAACRRQDGAAAAVNIHVLGTWQWPVEKRHNHYYEFWSYSAGWSENGPMIAPGEVLLEPLASQLGAKVGDEIVFRVQKADLVSLDAPMSSRSQVSVALRLQVVGNVPTSSLGAFGPRNGLTPALNAFVNLAELQRATGLEGKANVLVAGGVIEQVNSPFADKVAELTEKLAGRQMAFKASALFGHPPRMRGGSQAQANYQEALANAATLADYEAALQVLPGVGSLELSSPRVFLDPAFVHAIRDAPSDLRYFPPVDYATGVTNTTLLAALEATKTNAQPLLTYLANLLSVGSNSTPYSMVTAAGAPWTPPGLRDDEIVLNQWLADDLHAKTGDALTLVYFDPESGARLAERTNIFRVHSIVPMQMPWADRTLMPHFPGIEKAETTAEWDTAFPLIHKIRPQDDEYWREHRGTPKAFITLAAGQKMWANRFGNLTAIRFPISSSLVAADVRRILASKKLPGEEDPAASPPSAYAQILYSFILPHSAAEESHFAFRAELERKILATLKPEEFGLRFEPVREQALQAAAQSQDFGGLFLGFSLFVIVAALLLMALLFQFSLEQRAAEIGTLLAIGFTPKQVRRLYLREGAALSLLGGILGVLGGLAYARAMLHGLATLWRDAVGASALKFFVTPQTLLVGLGASTLVAVLTLWLALRKQARQPARVLLAGALECGDLSPAAAGQLAPQEGCDHSPRSKLAWLALAAALALVLWPLANGDTANPGTFFGAGSLILLAGLAFVNARLVPLLPQSSILHPPSSFSLALRGLTRRRSRSLATVAMLASAIFLIVSIGVFRLDANRDATKRTSGTGGFALIGESTMPIVADLNTKAGREAFALNEADFAEVNVVPCRVHAGDEASCLNLNHAQKPRLLGVNPQSLQGRFTFAKGDGWPALNSAFRVPHSAFNEVPAIGDAASIQWAMGKKVGDALDYVDERGQPFKVRIVGAVANSILQGQLLIDEAEFVKRFPGESGYKYFLVDVPTNRVAELSARLSRALQDAGLELTPAPQRLAQFNAVQNTYLGTFQILGGLGLLLGSAGLGIVVLRNVLERRGELAVLLAVGWPRAAVNQLVLREHLALLGLGLAVGCLAAAVAVVPSLLTPGAEFPLFTLGLTLLAVLVNGLLWTWLATRAALRGELLPALRGE
jgi:ABC-type antimicrobial peptide transport system permease subunit